MIRLFTFCVYYVSVINFCFNVFRLYWILIYIGHWVYYLFSAAFWNLKSIAFFSNIIGHFITYFPIFTVEFINPDSMGTMRLFLHQHLIVESIKRIMTTFTFDALRAATVLTMYNNAALSLWKKMGLECFWSRTPGPWLVCFFRPGKIPHEPNPQHLSH